ncbi:hypothetical protein ACQ3I4_09615 [Zafaria sp. Z1313]|uniref:hypothetical protein n=1 Tax=unclassified Zafaria TaxID=2828765 RepID=UPI002E76DD59|nr:hypothetical protein [Zafaria sp. J156]MEE1621824.1 hypothetical protein [Zafaria sp. J156]
MSTATLASTATAGRAHPLAKIVKLHFVDRSRMIDVPLMIFAGTVGISIIIMLILQAFVPATPEQLSEGFRNSQAALWCFAGYFVNVGVMAYARTMPYAMGMGATRRQYWWGTTVTLVLESLFLALAMVAFLALERATGHWFTGTRMFDTYVVGNGNYWYLFLMGFGISFSMLFIGAVFASLYLRWNQKGVLTAVFGIVVAILLAVLLVLWTGFDLIAWFGPFSFPKIAAVLVAIGLLGAAGSWLVLRRAPVGR